MEGGGGAWSDGQGKGPKVRICYVCGRGYGLASYDIHLKQCKIKWEAVQLGLPPAERKPLPRKPEVLQQQGGTTQELLNAQNDAATQAFNTEALDKCQHCGRTFLADRLKIHQKSCTAESPAKPVGSARLSSTGGDTSSRPTSTGRSGMARTARGPGSKPGIKASTTTGHISSDLGSEAFGGPVQRESGAPLAGNYGGIGSRSSRGHSASLPECSTSSLSDRSLESIDNRLSRLEQELMETREEIKKLRSCVEVLQPPSS